MANVIHVTRFVDIGYGSLVVYDTWQAGTATIHLMDGNGSKAHAYYAEVKRYQDADGRFVYAATFPRLPTGNYLVYEPGFTSCGEKRVTVFPDAVAEVKYT